MENEELIQKGVIYHSPVSKNLRGGGSLFHSHEDLMDFIHHVASLSSVINGGSSEEATTFKDLFLFSLYRRAMNWGYTKKWAPYYTSSGYIYSIAYNGNGKFIVNGDIGERSAMSGYFKERSDADAYLVKIREYLEYFK